MKKLKTLIVLCGFLIGLQSAVFAMEEEYKDFEGDEIFVVSPLMPHADVMQAVENPMPLKALDFRECEHFTSQEIAKVVERCSCNLEELYINNVEVISAMVGLGVTLPSLKKLVIAGAYVNLEQADVIFGVCPNLQDLIVAKGYMCTCLGAQQLFADLESFIANHELDLTA